MLGVGFGVAVTIGNAIGAGILRAPGEVAGHLPVPWLYLAAWLAGGLYALLGALQFAELGTMVPRSGGQYVFARRAFGEYPAFLVGWSDWISTCGSTAAIALVVGEFLGALVPALRQYGTASAAAIVALFAALQWRGIGQASLVQHVTSGMKALVLAALVAAAFVLGGDRAAAAAVPDPDGWPLAAAFVLALQSVIYTYDGWSGVIYFSEEVSDAPRDVPRSLIGGVAAIIGTYLLVNAAILYVLPVSQVAGEPFALGAMASALVGPLGDPVFRLLTIVSMLSALNACHLMASRVLFAMSRDGLFVGRVAAVNAGGTPTAALLLGTMVAVLFVAFGRTFAGVIAVLSFFFVANYALSFLAVFVLRRREPDAVRPHRAWGYPWTTGAALAGSALFLAGAVASDTATAVYALGLLAASYPGYRVLRAVAVTPT